MEIVLLKDVEKVGKEGAVLNVKPGYARNYLLPQGLAVQAGAAQLQLVQQRKRQAERNATRGLQTAEALKRKIEGLSLTFKLSVGEQGEPFGSVSPNDVLKALAKAQVPLVKRQLKVDGPFKSLGVFEVPVQVHPELTATLKVSVIKA